MEENKSLLEVGKTYPAVLIGVTSEYDDIRGVYKTVFKYRVYLLPKKIEEVVDDFYWWNCPSFKRNTIEKIYRVMSVYNLVLIPRDYRNETVFANTCNWLIGTRVELSPYRYKGIRYKILCTERNNVYRTDKLWKCMLENNLDKFPELLEKEEIEREKLSEEMSNLIASIQCYSEDDFDFDEYTGEFLDDLVETTPSEKKKQRKRRKPKQKRS